MGESNIFAPAPVGGGGATTVVQPTASLLNATVVVSGTVSVSVANFPAIQPVSGTVTANQGTAPWVVSGTVVLGAGAAAIGTVGVTGTVAVTQSTSPWVVSGTVAATQSGTWTTRIVGNAGAILDGVITAAIAPANGIPALVVNNTTPPSLTTGQSVAAQCDYEGSLFTKPIRRSQTVAKATTIASSSTATTVLAAQAAGIFADISKLIITPTPAATGIITTGFTATLSDGTNSYIFDMDSGNIGSATVPGTDGIIINLEFNPPLPATAAATAWTLQLSVATVTVHVTVVAVLQKAS